MLLRTIYYLLFLSCLGLFACKFSKSSLSDTPQEYTCSMHPGILRNEPGSCPICKMPLVLKIKASNLEIDRQDSALSLPTNYAVISNSSIITPSLLDIPIRLRAWGKIQLDTRYISSISARFSGRIEKMYVRYNYQRLRKGQKIMDIYSPEILTSIEHLLYLIHKDSSAVDLIFQAKQKLLLLGIDKRQLDSIINQKKLPTTISLFSNADGYIRENMGEELSMNGVFALNGVQELTLKEGMYVNQKQVLFNVFNPNKLWAKLNVYATDAPLIHKGQDLIIYLDGKQHKSIKAKVDYILPYFSKGDKTLSFRAYLQANTSIIPAESRLSGEVEIAPKKRLFVPKDAVIFLGKRAMVFVKTANGFIPKQVNVGIEIKDKIQILHGIEPTDSIAQNASYFIDSDSFLQLK